MAIAPIERFAGGAFGKGSVKIDQWQAIMRGEMGQFGVGFLQGKLANQAVQISLGRPIVIFDLDDRGHVDHNRTRAAACDAFFKLAEQTPSQ